MASQRVTRVICAADVGGSAKDIERLNDAAERHRAHVVALVGDLSGAAQRATEGYRAVFKALGAGGRPAYWVPGPGDAPVDEYLREAANMEVAFPFLRGVHGTAAFAPDGHVVFAGFGGEVSDDPEAPREETARLSYPRWEPDYRLKVLGELSEHQLALLLSTPPAHKGLGTPGSEVLAELVASHRARLVVCGGGRGSEMIGRSLVVAPGSVRDGHYAVADLRSHDVHLEQFAAAA